MPVYAGTLFLSAFLLFAVQPMFTKMVLPRLGGSPAVWNTAIGVEYVNGRHSECDRLQATTLGRPLLHQALVNNSTLFRANRC